MARPTFSTQISLGNMIQLVLLLIAIASAWFTLDNRVTNNSNSLEAVQIEQKDFRLRVRSVENGLTRSDERFTSILQFMSRMEKSIEQLSTKVDQIRRSP